MESIYYIKKTLVIIKPDAVKAGHIGDIITFLEWSGFNLCYIKKETLTLDKLYKHYEHLKDMSFFKDLLDFMTSGDSVVIVVEGDDVINRVRKLVGATDPAKADENIIRSLFGTSITKNAVHASDSILNSEKEIKNLL